MKPHRTAFKLTKIIEHYKFPGEKKQISFEKCQREKRRLIKTQVDS